MDLTSGFSLLRTVFLMAHAVEDIRQELFGISQFGSDFWETCKNIEQFNCQISRTISNQPAPESSIILALA
ncbi:uncharacterized protein LY89DRAFT_689670 [Mollisia scopiformis]|uniref:Uncharacterized protein n=1 Tax=Mollisia scopiformis TaxID=149040 RepID=A0A132BDU6_MOLSC|nr:uncharacterized protein LY89DRAFT_689670 [Mollisia scopiformis]KUJ10423.1 hypothetical protein LY89DRAFT_689670 [Mollisia scopiformis]